MNKNVALELAKERISNEIVIHKISDDAHEAMGRGRFPYYPAAFEEYDKLLKLGSVEEMHRYLRRRKDELLKVSAETRDKRLRDTTKEERDRTHNAVGLVMALSCVESFVDDLMWLIDED